MKEKIIVDLAQATERNFTTVQEALTELQTRIDQNQDKEVLDVCGDLLLHYKDRMKNIECAEQQVQYALKHNVILRYLKE